MTGQPELVVYPDAAELARATASRLATRLATVQRERGEASVVLTGGTISIALYQAIAGDPARDTVDWGRVDLWWGDERFLPAGHPDRNETQAREALLNALTLDPSRVHPMPASDGPDGDDPGAAARRYAADLAAAARRYPAGPAATAREATLPRFDLLLLGIGPDGHVASLFPGQLDPDERRTVVPVLNSPKPPPVRISLTLPAINTAREIWFLAAGAGKADAVRRALAGADVPAAAVAPPGQTIWLLDRAAAPG